MTETTVTGTGLYLLPSHPPAPLVAFLPLAVGLAAFLVALRLLRRK